jgi:hypothetical protein
MANIDIPFKTITSTVDGVNASTGKQTEEAFNDNFALAKQLLEELLGIASVTIISNDMTGIKVDKTTTPYTLYYTCDDPTSPNPGWMPLMNVSFSQLTGQPSENIALNTALNAKANQTDLATLTTRVGGIDSSISQLTSDVNDRVRTLHNSVLYLKYDSNTNCILYSTNGSTWVDILSSGISFSGITGNASDNASLVAYVGAQIQSALTSYATQTALSNHTQNQNNPHAVTKAQIGLSNVDNTADIDKPISNAVQEALNSIAVDAVPTYNLTAAGYRTMHPTDSNIYFTSNSYVVND